MRNFDDEIKKRIEFIQQAVEGAKASGIVFANSGGKDAALVGILCKMACENTISLMLPCGVSINYKSDWNDAIALAKQYNIPTKGIDLAETKKVFMATIQKDHIVTERAMANIAPRLRMLSLYTIATSENRLVAGTGNRSEIYLGYFTKFGDGGYDINPIADLTCTEVFDFLRFLGAPQAIIDKPPSAGLFDGQTDEAELGITYERIDKFLHTGEAVPADRAIIDRYHSTSAHKRRMPLMYGVE